MVKRIAQFMWSSRVQFAKYVVVGLSGVVLDIGSLWFLKERLAWNAVFAVVVNQAVLLGYNFSLNKYWSFQNTDIPHAQAVRYLSLAGFNYAFAIAMMYLWHDRLGFHYLGVRIGSIACMTLWNFILYKKWVYKTVAVHNSDASPG